MYISGTKNILLTYIFSVIVIPWGITPGGGWKSAQTHTHETHSQVVHALFRSSPAEHAMDMMPGQKREGEKRRKMARGDAWAVSVKLASSSLLPPRGYQNFAQFVGEFSGAGGGGDQYEGDGKEDYCIPGASCSSHVVVCVVHTVLSPLVSCLRSHKI